MKGRCCFYFICCLDLASSKWYNFDKILESENADVSRNSDEKAWYLSIFGNGYIEYTLCKISHF